MIPNNAGKTKHIPLGKNSAPHGVIVGPDGAPWITDSGLNAIVRVDPKTEKVDVFPLPKGTPYINLNTATFDNNGILWYTGQSGYYGRVDPKTGKAEVFEAPRGRGPYGICTAPDGSVYYASLAGSHIARIDTKTGKATVIEPPTPGQGARRVWADSKSRIWVSEWNSGQVSMYDPKTNQWREWKAPRRQPADLRRVRGQQRHRLAVRFRRQRHGALRSEDREVQRDSATQPRQRRAPDSRPARRGVVAVVGSG